MIIQDVMEKLVERRVDLAAAVDELLSEGYFTRDELSARMKEKAQHLAHKSAQFADTGATLRVPERVANRFTKHADRLATSSGVLWKRMRQVEKLPAGHHIVRKLSSLER